MKILAILTNKAQVIILIILSFILGWLTSVTLVKNPSRVYPIREDTTGFHYIKPLIFIDNSQIIYEELAPLKEQIDEYINSEISSGNIKRTSFYVRDLNTGIWTGVRPDDDFVPASMLKIAIPMVYLRIAEDDPTVVFQKFLYKKDQNEKQNYPPQLELTDGYYEVGQLIGQTIVESDNAAARALSVPREKEIVELYNTLRITVPTAQGVDFLSPREVSRIFRTLYGSTYLLNSYSEQVLELLTRTKFNNGITAGVDPNIKVAHKFGEHTTYYTDQEPLYQLHDCGIVYYPNKPYFICIMTEGRDLNNLEAVLKNVSLLSFNYLKKQ